MRKQIIIKILVLVLLVVVFNVVMNSFGVTFTNEIAINQLDNSNAAFNELQWVSTAKGYAPIAFIAIAILMFAKEIKILIKKIKENM